MSGGFYQRYVPAAPPANPKEDKTTTVGNFYTRYVPPTKIGGTSDAVINGPTKETASEGEVKPRKRRKHREEKTTAEVGDDPSDQGAVATARAKEVDKNAKHRRINESFKRSTESLGGNQHGGSREADSIDKDSPEGPVKHGLEPIPQPTEDEDIPVHIEAPMPDWMRDPVRVKAEQRDDMDKMNLSKETLQALRKRGYDEAFPVQTAVLPLMVRGQKRHKGDICVSASTGSGKTLAYVLPMIENLRGCSDRKLRGLVVVPTRELVIQAREALEMCATGSHLQVGIAVGNRTMAEEKATLMTRKRVHNPDKYHELKNMTLEERISKLVESLNEDESDEEEEAGYEKVWESVSAVDILVCTPGRLVDHIRTTKGFTLRDVQMLAIDEADRLLDQSFQQWVETVVPELEWMPELDDRTQLLNFRWGIRPKRDIQKVILSATMTKDIDQLLSLKLKNPKLVVLEGGQQEEHLLSVAQTYELPPTLRETVISLGKEDQKPLVLVALLGNLLGNGQKSNETPGGLRVLRQSKVRDKNGNADSDTSSSGSSSSEDTSSEKESDETSSSGSDDSDSNGGREQSTSSEEDTSSDEESDETSSSGSDDSDSDDEREKSASNNHPSRGILIFTNTNEAAMRLSQLLALIRPDWACKSLTNSTESSSGRRILSSFRSGKLSILVASDRASRGLDIPNLATVINYDVPTSLLSYVHRVGRTARAGQSGDALTMLAFHEAKWFWAEIGKSKLVHRPTSIQRRKGVGREVTEAQREEYAAALTKLGQEARGA